MIEYNASDKYSIWNHSKGLLGKTLEEAVGKSLSEDNTGKGKLGQLEKTSKPQLHHSPRLSIHRNTLYIYKSPQSSQPAELAVGRAALRCEQKKLLKLLDYLANSKISAIYWKSSCFLNISPKNRLLIAQSQLYKQKSIDILL